MFGNWGTSKTDGVLLRITRCQDSLREEGDYPCATEAEIDNFVNHVNVKEQAIVEEI